MAKKPDPEETKRGLPVPCPIMAGMFPTVALLAAKLQTTQHEIWLGLWTNSHNKDFDAEMRMYMKTHDLKTGALISNPDTKGA